MEMGGRVVEVGVVGGVQIPVFAHTFKVPAKVLT